LWKLGFVVEAEVRLLRTISRFLVVRGLKSACKLTSLTRNQKKIMINILNAAKKFAINPEHVHLTSIRASPNTEKERGNEAAHVLGS